ncbi:MAG: sigma-70 family RNA polymerase sigma factor [Planctomycetaceae bacterium]|nr:sigma-70 family RNA polymerase sigma factor [Planctomycetaceae bacterium]
MNHTLTATRASLILRLKDADDVAAWDEFAAIYAPVVYRVATSRGFQPADAENLVQEVFLAVANSISRWLEREDRGRFRPWLVRIARNESIDMLTERATRTLGRDGSAAEQILAGLPAREEFSDALDLEYERTVFGWAAQQVRAAVAEQTWEAFWLTSIDGLSVDDVAGQLKMRPGNVYLARSRVMARIRQLVGDYEVQS